MKYMICLFALLFLAGCGVQPMSASPARAVAQGVKSSSTNAIEKSIRGHLNQVPGKGSVAAIEKLTVSPTSSGTVFAFEARVRVEGELLTLKGTYNTLSKKISFYG